MIKILFLTLIGTVILFLAYLSFTEEKTIIHSSKSIEFSKDNKLDKTKNIDEETFIRSEKIEATKENKKNSDELLLNQDIILKSLDENPSKGKTPGESLQNISIEEIKNDPLLDDEEKENRISDKACYSTVVMQSPILQIDNKQMRKMIEEDENLNLNK